MHYFVYKNTRIYVYIRFEMGRKVIVNKTYVTLLLDIINILL